MSRLGAIAGQDLDLLVVGGGIIGAGIARDAALRGLSVALFDKEDFGGATTAASSRLIHGGLRYLETFDLGLVRLDLRERETLLRIAPHLVEPLEFLIPFYGASRPPRWKLRAGLLLYDLLAFDSSLPRHRLLTRSEAAAAEPLLCRDGLTGGALYWDAHAPMPERLCLENLLDARRAGAAIFNYAEVLGAAPEPRGGLALRVRDRIDGSEAEVRGRAVVNASGPWLDRVDARLAGTEAPRLRTTKGTHVVGPQISRRALVLFSRRDGRLFFVIPWLGQSAIGTTDTDYAGDPGRARATADDVAYLVASAGDYLPVDRERLHRTTAGVRALAAGSGPESRVSRMHRIVDEAPRGRPGLISVVGGKITGFRAIAEEATDLVCRRLGVRRRSTTASTPLPGAGAPPPFEGLPVPEAAARHLVSLYGSRAREVLDLIRTEPRLGAPLAAGGPDLLAQVRFAVRTEECRSLADFLLRRTRIAFGPDLGLGAAAAAAAELGRELGWAPEQLARAVAAYGAQVAELRVPPVPGR